MENITVLFCPPGQKPALMNISNEVPVLEKLLKGKLGVKELEDNGICLLFNDLGQHQELDLNRVVQGDPIFGPCIFCRKEADIFKSLTDEEIKELEFLLS